MDLLVLGAGGLLGSNVVRVGTERKHSVVGTYHSVPPLLDVPLEQFDLRDDDAFRSLLGTYHPDTVINCAAMTDVDGCEGLC